MACLYGEPGYLDSIPWWESHHQLQLQEALGRLGLGLGLGLGMSAGNVEKGLGAAPAGTCYLYF